MENMLEVAAICKEYGIMSVLDASLLQDNLYFIKTREAAAKDMTIAEIIRKIADQMDLIYFSSRKLGFARGGAIVSNNESLILKMKAFIPLYEGFLTYGGMEVRAMEAMAVGLMETLDEEIINQGPIFIEYLVKELSEYGVPMVKPAGGLGQQLMLYQPELRYQLLKPEPQMLKEQKQMLTPCLKIFSSFTRPPILNILIISLSRYIYSYLSYHNFPDFAIVKLKILVIFIKILATLSKHILKIKNRAVMPDFSIYFVVKFQRF